MADFLLRTFPWWFFTLSHALAFLLGIMARDWWRSRRNGSNGNGSSGEAEEKPASIRAAM